MTIIRQSQIESFEDALRTTFDASVAETFRDVWPDRVQLLGDAYLRFVHDAIDRAYSHELHSDRDAARFVNLTLLWGLGFEAQPQHQWARDILDDREVPAGLRVDHLFQMSEQELSRLSVPEGSL